MHTKKAKRVCLSVEKCSKKYNHYLCKMLIFYVCKLTRLLT